MDTLINAMDLLNSNVKMIAIAGSGGKTTLMYSLARELAECNKKVIVTTSTHLFIPANHKLILSEDLEQIKAALLENNIVVVGLPYKNDMLTSPNPSLFAAFKEIVDYVLVEADGSRSNPLKAHAEHEPVIPPEADYIFGVVGFSALGQQLEEICHRPELAIDILGVTLEHSITTEDIAKLLMNPKGIIKTVADRDKFTVVINQAKDKLQEALDCAEKIINLGAKRVFIAELNSSQPVLKILT